MHSLYKYVKDNPIVARENTYGLYVKSLENDVIVVKVNMDESGVEFDGIMIEEYSVDNNLDRYFYQQVSANGTPLVPTLTIKDKDLKVKDKYTVKSKKFGKLISAFKDNASDEEQIKRLLDFVENSDLIDRLSDVTKETKDCFLLTFMINREYIGQSPLYAKIREKMASQRDSAYYQLGKKKITGKNMSCSICYEKKSEVWGYVSTYNFYTSKTEFASIAGGFKKDKAHKNYPVCPTCAIELNKVKELVDDFFEFKFSGLRYILIPEFISVNPDDETVKEILDIIVDSRNIDDPRLGGFTLGKDKYLLEDDKGFIFNLLAEKKSIVSYSMLFYEENNAEFKIMMMIDDVFPAQFDAILKAKEKVDSKKVFQEIVYKGERLNFKFDLLKEIFPIKSKKYGDFTKAFLEVLRNVFLSQKIEYDFILQRIVQVMRQRFSREEYYEIFTEKSFLSLSFLVYLSVLDINKYKSSKEVKVNERYEAFFEEHSAFFQHNAIKAVFLIGVLCQNLLSIQYVQRKATPFRKKLNGLKLSPGMIIKLYPQIIEKLEQYDSNYYKSLQEDISKLLVSDSLESLSNDEISYYFVLGMTLRKTFKEVKDEQTEEE